MKNRLNNLIDLRLCMEHLGDKDANSEIYKLNIIKNNDVAKLEMLEAASEIIKEDLLNNEHKAKRKSDYIKDGLTIERFVELLIEDDQEAMADFKARRLPIKAKHPKRI